MVLAFLLAGLTTWAFVPHLRAFALGVGWAERTKARPSHREPLANTGGLAIFAGVIVALVAETLLRRIVIEAVQLQILAILVGGSFLILSGFVDDQFGLPLVIRLGTQILAALLIAAAGIRIQVAFGGPLATTYSVLLTIVWMLAITNAMQLIDNIDGLAGGVGAITALSLLAVSAQFTGRAASTLLLAALAGAALGFLRHNFPPARLVMGDSGAYFLGFVLAAVSILGHLKTHTVFALVPTAIFIVLPSVQVGRVMVRRLRRGKNPFSILGSAYADRRVLSRRFSSRHDLGHSLGGEPEPKRAGHGSGAHVGSRYRERGRGHPHPAYGLASWASAHSSVHAGADQPDADGRSPAGRLDSSVRFFMFFS